MKTSEEIKTLKEECKRQSENLPLCPFCKGKAEFVVSQSGQLMIQHLPLAGVICPARYQQYCDTFEQGMGWWRYLKTEKRWLKIINQIAKELGGWKKSS